MGSRNDVVVRTRTFLETASAHSRVEIYVTGTAAELPTLLFEHEIERTSRQERQKHVKEALRELYRKWQGLISASPLTMSSLAYKDIKPLPQSSILEDTHRLVIRANALRQPSEIVVSSDAQQFSAALHSTDILRATDDGAALVARMLQRLPRLEKPPLSITLVFTPGSTEEGVLTGSDEGRLKDFFLRMFSAWGAQGKVTEPRALTDEASH